MTAEGVPAFTPPTPLRVGGVGVYLDPGRVPDAVITILTDAAEWGMLGIDLEWNKDGRITWVGLGTSKRAMSFWWPTVPDEARKWIADAVASPDLPKLGQNGIQADRAVWEREVGPTGGQWEDTMFLHHAAFPGIAHDLQQIVSQFLVVPPWKAWRRIAMRAAAEERKVRAKAEKKAAKQAVHQAKNGATKASAEERKAEKAAAHAAKQAGYAAERERKEAEKAAKKQTREAEILAQRTAKEQAKQQRQAEHEARNAALKAEKEARKAASATGQPRGIRQRGPAPGSPPPGVVTPQTPEPERVARAGDDDETPFEVFPMNGLLCSTCGEPQRLTPTGETCPNGHDGALGVEGEPDFGTGPLLPLTAEPPVPVPEGQACGACGSLMPPDGRPCVACTVFDVPPAAEPPAAEPPAAEPEPEPEAAAPPAVVAFAPDAPRVLLKIPRGPGGALIKARVASLPPAVVKRLRVIVTQPDGSEKEVES